jgi:hypothetical protein
MNRRDLCNIGAELSSLQWGLRTHVGLASIHPSCELTPKHLLSHLSPFDRVYVHIMKADTLAIS